MMCYALVQLEASLPLDLKDPCSNQRADTNISLNPVRVYLKRMES